MTQSERPHDLISRWLTKVSCGLSASMLGAYIGLQ